MEWTENVIIVDADYADRVAFDLTVNFERMLERRVPPADMARWVECIALDGGLRGTDHQVQVVLVHDEHSQRMENFLPSRFDELHGQAFSGALGEFLFTAVSAEGMVSREQLLLDVLNLVCDQPAVRRLMVVPSDDAFASVRAALSRTGANADNKGSEAVMRQVTLFTMQPSVPPTFGRTATGQQVDFSTLGFSLLSALGINADEIDRKLRSDDRF